jgi:endonuclease YncB( thermonuclease family)
LRQLADVAKTLTMTRYRVGLRVALAVLTTAGSAAAQSPMLGLEIGGAAAIARVTPKVELRLEDGRTALLDGIVVPELAAAEVETVLAPLLARAQIVAVGGAVADRYDRLQVQAASPDGRSLQVALLEAGLALVQPLPGADPAVLETQLAAEARAEAARRGIWNNPAAIVVESESDSAASRLGQFTLLEGRVLQASAQQRYFYLNFGPNWRTDTTARIDREVLRTMQRAGFEPEALDGRRVRVRGTLFDENGPMIELWTHQGIEILP